MKDPATLRAKEDTGRFGPNSRSRGMYNKMYGKESLFQASEEWANIAKDAGISKAALAYRWITFHSALKAEDGDAVIVGASITPRNWKRAQRPSRKGHSMRKQQRGQVIFGRRSRTRLLWIIITPT